VIAGLEKVSRIPYQEFSKIGESRQLATLFAWQSRQQGHEYTAEKYTFAAAA
jgi:hypothetical protein